MRLGLSSYRFRGGHRGVLAADRVAKAASPLGRAERDRLEALAAKAGPALAKAILAALAAHPELIDLEALSKAIEKGQPDAALKALNDESLVPIYQQALKALSGTAIAAAEATAALPVFRGTAFVFDHLNPGLIDWLRRYSLDLIRGVSDQTREGVRSALVRGMNEGRNPRDVARHVKQIVGLTPSQEAAVGRFRKELETFHLRRSAKSWNLGGKIDRAPGGAQVFKPSEDGTPKDEVDARRLRDFRHDGTLKRAMEKKQALTPAQIDKMVGRYADRYRKFRAETIARTEAMRATNMGTMDAWRQAIIGGKVDENLTRRLWLTAKDERRCRVCQPVPKLNPAKGVKFGQPFNTPKGPVQLPPLHPNCRCSVFVRVYDPAQLGAGYAL